MQFSKAERASRVWEPSRNSTERGDGVQRGVFCLRGRSSPRNFRFLYVGRSFWWFHIGKFVFIGTTEGDQYCTWVILINPLLDLD